MAREVTPSSIDDESTSRQFESTEGAVVDLTRLESVVEAPIRPRANAGRIRSVGFVVEGIAAIAVVLALPLSAVVAAVAIPLVLLVQSSVRFGRTRLQDTLADRSALILVRSRCYRPPSSRGRLRR